MPSFIGFSTLGRNRKFTVTDTELVQRDLLNALSIRQGEVVHRPTLGSTVWNLLNEQQTTETQQAIKTEIERIVGQDPRILLNSLTVFFQDNGVLIEMDASVVPNSQGQLLRIFFNQATSTVSYL